MVLGIAIGGPAAIAATIFFLIHQIPVKTSLFLVDGMVEHSAGTSRLDRLSGLAHRSGFLAALFLLPALSLSGIPPFSGFVAKLGLLTAGINSREDVLVAVAIVGSLLTLVSMTKIWMSAFWGDPTAHAPGVGRRGRGAAAHTLAAGDDRADGRPGRRRPGHRPVRRADVRPVPRAAAQMTAPGGYSTVVLGS